MESRTSASWVFAGAGCCEFGPLELLKEELGGIGAIHREGSVSQNLCSSRGCDKFAGPAVTVRRLESVADRHSIRIGQLNIRPVEGVRP